MTTRVSLTILAWLLAATMLPGLAAQAPDAPPAPQAPAGPEAPAPPQTPPGPEPAEPTPQPVPADDRPQIITFGRPVVRIGQDYTLEANDAVREAVIIMGNARIEGRVGQNVVVILGDVTVADTAFIDDSLVVVGGTATIEGNARIDQDLVVVGGDINAPAGFSPRSEYVVIGSDMLGGRLQALVPWVTRGLLWGRLIVPDIGWVWGFVFLTFLAYAALNLLFDKAVLKTAQALTEKPLTAFAVGILALLLFPPVVTLLAVTVIGIPVIPVLVCALFIAGLLGRIAVARWIGMNAVRETDADSRLQGFRSLVIGMVIIVIAYMIPVLGIVTFATVAVLGLGAATMAFITAYRREHPVVKRTPPPVPPAVAPPVPPTPYAGAAEAAGGAAAPGAYAADIGAVPQVPPDAQRTSVPPPPPYTPPASPVSQGATEPTDLLSYPRGMFGERLAALVLDAILVAFVSGALDVDGPPGFVLLMLAYHVGFWTWKGTTVGGIIMNLRVVRMDGYRLRFADAAVRGLSAIFSVIVVGLGFFWILRDPERQSWHDRIAGTYVVKVPRNYPL